MEKDLLEKIQKLLNLSEKGIGGEKENAKRFLDKLMKKHGVSIDDLNDNKKTILFFKYATEFERLLLNQIIYAVLDEEKHETYGHKDLKKVIGCNVTKEQFIEIKMRFEIYYKSLDGGFMDFYRAFVMKNHIYPPSMKPVEADKKKRDQIRKAEILAEGIDKIQILKAIE